MVRAYDILRAALPVALLVAGCAPTTAEIGGVRFAARTIDLDGPEVTAADVDRDGHLDLLAAGDEISVLLGDGRGGFSAARRFPGGENPVDLALADLDGDGALDLAIANHETHYLTLLLGDGTGGFAPAASSPLAIAVEPHPHAVRAVDLDTDGHLDLIVDHRDGRGLLVLRGLGGATFESPGLLVDGGGDPYRGMAIGDLDGDGRLDLVTPNPRSVGIILQRGDGELTFAPPRRLQAGSPFGLELGDLDGDGRLDLVVGADEGAREVHLLRGNGYGGFTPAPGSPFRMAVGPKTIAIGDFDGDGTDDAAIAAYPSSRVLILLGRAEEPETAWLDAGEHPWGLAAGDFDEDGRDDLVIGDDARDEAILYLSRETDG